jgi:hypothetical protein
VKPRPNSAPAADEVFRSFHRARIRQALRVRVPLFVLAAAVLVAGVGGSLAVSPPARVDAATSTSTVAASAELLAGGTPGGAAVDAPPAVVPVDPPEAPGGVPPVEAVPTPPTVQGVPVAPTPSYSIGVGARGHQAELDSCQWVRMDVGASAPIVGAHNYCDGDVVLAMNVGEVVTVTGTDLDGDYQVTGSRDARAGDNAAAATAGLSGDIIFQTCYWDDALGLRLVSAVKVDLSLPPIVVG